MEAPLWFSAMLRLRITVADGPADHARSLIIFRAQDFEDALERALTRGRELESEDLNRDGQTIRWTLEAVETIDQLGEVLEDGREVYFSRTPTKESQPSEPPESIPFDSTGV